MIIYFHQKLSQTNSGANLLIYLKFPIIFEKRRESERQVRKHFRRFKSWIQASIWEPPYTSQNEFPKSMDGWRKFEILPWILNIPKWQNEYNICKSLGWQYSRRALFVFFPLRPLGAMYVLHKWTESKNNCSVCLSNPSHYVPDGGWVKAEMKSYFPK